jgi:hypothetical protein
MRKLLDFHSRATTFSVIYDIPLIQQRLRKPRGVRVPAKMVQPVAPNPVTGLCTTCTQLKMHVLTNAYFLLTEKIEGVQQDRSLTAS